MKRTLFFFLCSIMIFDAPSQAANVYTNTEVEKSALYQAGNNYQKDLLLFVDLLSTTHPAFAPNLNNPAFDLEQATQEGYTFLKNCNNYSVFSQYLTSIASKLNDSHTYVTPNLDKNGLMYLFQIQIQYPEVSLIMAPAQFSEQIGKEVTKINEKPVMDIVNSFKNCISSDNDTYFYEHVSGYLQFFSLWEKNPYYSKDSVLTVTMADGSEIKLSPRLRPQNMAEVAMIKRTSEKANAITQPQRKLFFYNILDKESICYFQFNQCTDYSTTHWDNLMSGKSLSDSVLEEKLSSVPRFDASIAQMFEEIKAQNINTLVIDVRNNGGGNSVLCEILLSYLKPFSSINLEKSYIRFSPFFEQHYPILAANGRKGLHERNITLKIGETYLTSDLDPLQQNVDLTEFMNKYYHYNSDENNIFKGNVIFIQGKKTFSSAGLLITDAIDNGIGKVIGDKSAYKPCHYGDVLMWELPNTKISGSISHKIFNRPDETKCNETCIIPEVLIENTLEPMLSGEDKCWNWIIENYSK